MMHYDGDIPWVAIPFMLLMISGMVVMMWLMMKMMMGGHSGEGHSADPGNDEIASLRSEVASLRRELESARTVIAASRPASESGSNKTTEP